MSMYSFKSSRIPAIEGMINSISMEEQEEEFTKAYKQATPVKDFHKFKKDDVVYIEVLDKLLRVTFLSDGRFF